GRDRPPRRIAGADARRQVTNDETGQIANPGVLPDARQRRAAAQEQERPAQELIGLDPLGGDQQRIPAALAMRAKGVLRHWDQLVAGGPTRRPHPAAYAPRPRDPP